MAVNTDRSAWLAPALLSFVAGYVDTVGFVALFSLFTAHVTGNFVLIGATLGQAAGGGSGLMAKLLALPCFIVAVAISTLALRRVQSAQGNAARWALVAQAALVALFMVSGLLAAPLVDGDAPLALLTGMLGVAAMSVQNAASRIVFGDMAPSTVMTGNVTQLVIDSVDLAKGGAPGDAATASRRVAKMLPPILAFATGALLGGLGYHLAGFASLTVAVLALAVAAATSKQSEPAATAPAGR